MPWLGEVPAHWEVLPNRATFSEVNDREHPQEQMLSVTIAEGVVRQKELLEDSSKKDSSRPDKTAYKLVESGDVAYNKMRAWQGAVGVSQYRGIVSPAYVVQTATKWYALTLPPLSAENTSVCERSGAMVLRHYFRHVESST